MPIARPGTSALIATAATTYHTITNTTNVVGVVKEILFCNTTGTARTTTVYFVPSGSSAAASNTVISAVSIAANTTVRFPFNTYLAANETIQALASAASAIMIKTSVLEFGPTPVSILQPQTPALLTASAATYYTVTTNRVGNPKEILLCNTTSTARTVTIYFIPFGGSAAAANTVVSAVSVAANTTHRIPMNTYLASGAFVQALASAASAVSIRISPVEYI